MHRCLQFLSKVQETCKIGVKSEIQLDWTDLSNMSHLCCCKLRTLSAVIGVVFFLVQAAFLAATFVLMSGVQDHVADGFDWFATESKNAGGQEGYEELKEKLVKRASDFLAIPITISIVLMTANSLLIWATVVGHKILVWPWLILHTLEWIGFVALLIFFMIVVPQPYMKVILFLVVCPFLVIFAFCIFVVKCFYNYLRDLNLKDAVAAVYNYQQNQQKTYIIPATVYSTGDSPLWDHPLPIWTSQPAQQQQAVLDPHLLQRLDPRYASSQSYYPGYSSSKAGSSSSRRRGPLTPTLLPDGTLVVPLGDEVDDLTEIEEEDEDEVAAQRQQRKRGRRNSVPRSSEDGRSVMSLSDKYRQQEEVEVFEEFYQLPEHNQDSPLTRSTGVSEH